MTQPPFDISKVLEQAQEFGGKLKRIQEGLRHRTVEATVGGGMVEVSVNGRMEVVSIRIDPQAVDRRDVEMLQDLVVSAVNQAMRNAQRMMQEEMQQAMGLPMGDILSMLNPSK